jgi:hypothetical protein
MPAAIKSQLGSLNQPETTALCDNNRRLPHTISSLLPPDPKYEPHPQASDSPVRLGQHAHTYPTPLSINGLSGSDQSSIFISPSFLFSPQPQPHIIMPSQAYVFPPASGSSATGFFLSGPTAPHAFATMHTSPRDQHLMYAALGTPSFQGGKSSQDSSAKSAPRPPKGSGKRKQR